MPTPSPDSTNTAVAVEDKALSKEDLIDFLAEPDEKPETLELEDSSKKPAKDKKEGDKEDKEDKEGN